jgi:hypothetical protein
MKNIISQFIPIVIIFLLLSYSDEIAIFSHSILGKMISILIIGYYTVIDKYVGLLVCILFIFYYQTDYVESMLNINESMWDWRVDHDFVDDYSYLETFSELKPGCNCGSPKPLQEAKKEDKLEEEDMILKGYENFENYRELYEDKSEPANEDVKNTFRKENCSSKGVLQYKNMEVKNDMAEHVFPELKFRDHVCNPCSNTCDFSIIESRIKTEDELKPINTKYM